jgi:hypothetical protein
MTIEYAMISEYTFLINESLVPWVQYLSIIRNAQIDISLFFSNIQIDLGNSVTSIDYIYS